MRISLTIFALAALCIGQNAFAQAAPKEVIVVDGQIAVNNFPASQTVDGTVSVDNLPAVQDVWVQGATNPLPVMDVTAPIGEEFHGRVGGTGTTNPSQTIDLGPFIPAGKLLKLKNISVNTNGHSNTLFQCAVTLGPSNVVTLPMLQWLDIDVIRFSDSVDQSFAQGMTQWNELPAVKDVSVFCVNLRADRSAITKPSGLTVSWFGYLYDAPTP